MHIESYYSVPFGWISSLLREKGHKVLYYKLNYAKYWSVLIAKPIYCTLEQVLSMLDAIQSSCCIGSYLIVPFGYLHYCANSNIEHFTTTSNLYYIGQSL
jgi:hypothetical protein